MFEKMEKAWHRFIDWLAPSHDEISLFVMSITLVFLFFTNFDDFSWIISGGELGIAAFIVIVIGIVVSVIHAFSHKEKSERTKHLLMAYAIVINFVAGLCLADHLLAQPITNRPLLLFAGINVLTGFFLILLIRLETLDPHKAVSDYDTNKTEIVFTTIFAIIIILISQYYYQNHWSITLSVCTFYASNIHKHVNLRTK